MRARDVIGKTIIDVEHVHWWNGHIRQMQVDVSVIILDDGTRLVPFAFEAIDGPGATIYAIKPKKGVR